MRSELPLYRAAVAVTAAGVLTGLVHPLAGLGFAVVVPWYAGVGAAVGVWASSRTAKPGRAVAMLAVGGVVGMYLAVVTATASQTFARGSIGPSAAGCPPVAIGVVLAARDVRWVSAAQAWGAAGGVVAGMVGWGLVGRAAVVLAGERVDAEREYG